MTWFRDALNAELAARADELAKRARAEALRQFGARTPPALLYQPGVARLFTPADLIVPVPGATPHDLAWLNRHANLAGGRARFVRAGGPEHRAAHHHQQAQRRAEH